MTPTRLQLLLRALRTLRRLRRDDDLLETVLWLEHWGQVVAAVPSRDAGEAVEA